MLKIYRTERVAVAVKLSEARVIAQEHPGASIVPVLIRLRVKPLRFRAASMGGELVSTSYESAKTLMTWRCAEKHEWQASADNVRNKNSWCPHCDMQARKGRPRPRRNGAEVC
jgi:hypothetical protein